MDVYGPSKPSENVYSKLGTYHRKTCDIVKPENLASSVHHGHRKPVMITKRNRSVNLRKLLLTLTPDQIPENPVIETIRSWFLELDSAVTVRPMENKEDTYTIIFKDVVAAHEAVLKFGKLGYMIKKKYPPRACPNDPIKYKALKPLVILKGKSFRGNFKVGSLVKGEKVWVNQVKGRRARVIKRKEERSEDNETRGWVSLFSEDGTPLLIQLDESGDGQI